MLRYYYGVMASGKTATLLMSSFQREKDGKKCLIMKPYDDRDKDKISSRIGIEKDCVVFTKDDNLVDVILGQFRATGGFKYIYVDECQFLTPKQVRELWTASKSGFEVLCFGLKTTFKNTLFDSVQELMVYAQKIKTIQPAVSCKYCTDVATTHLLLVDGKPTLEFPTEYAGDIEGDIQYACVCQSCWHHKHEEK